MVIGRVIGATGWTFDYVLHSVDLRVVRILYKRWAVVPPLVESVAAFLGVSDNKRGKGKSGKINKLGNPPGSAAAAAAALQQAGFKGDIRLTPTKLCPITSSK